MSAPADVVPSAPARTTALASAITGAALRVKNPLDTASWYEGGSRVV